MCNTNLKRYALIYVYNAPAGDSYDNRKSAYIQVIKWLCAASAHWVGLGQDKDNVLHRGEVL